VALVVVPEAGIQTVAVGISQPTVMATMVVAVDSHSVLYRVELLMVVEEASET
jgi:hypothetical protein